MLTRQRSLLHLVRLAGGEIDRLVLTKWAFLVRHESMSRGGGSFYDFVPYQYGPFSFSLYQEAEKLVSCGYLTEVNGKVWKLGHVPAPAPDSKLAKDLSAISSRFADSSVDDLLDYVYETYPRFTINSKRKKLAQRVIAPLAVYTAGYEGKSIDGFLDGLIRAGIAHLIDVRMNPIARRYGFHRSTLSRLCGNLGIQYTHVPSLGIASELRQNLQSDDDYKSLFEKYEATTLVNETSAIEKVSTWIRESPSVLMCMESAACSCHRGRLAVPVSKHTGLSIIHL